MGEISSYRLGKVKSNMLEAIKTKNTSFKYYVILTKIREKTGVTYALYIIPSDLHFFDPLNYT